MNLTMGNDSSMGRSSLRFSRMRDVSDLSLSDISRNNNRGSRSTRRSSLPRRASSMKDKSHRSLPRRTPSGSGIMKKQTLQDSLDSMEDLLNGSEADNGSRRSSIKRMPVAFDTAEIREYPVILDCSREGPALTIDWNHSSEKFTTVDLHKEAKQQSPARCLEPAERAIILLGSGAVSKAKLVRHLSSDSLESMSKAGKGSTRRAGKKPVSASDGSSSKQNKTWQSKTTSSKSGSKNIKSDATTTNKNMYSKMKSAARKMVAPI